MAARCDRIADTFDHTRCAVPLIADRLMSLLGAASGASVLHVASGTGNCTPARAERGLTAVGTGVSRIMLTKARTEQPLLALGSERFAS